MSKTKKNKDAETRGHGDSETAGEQVRVVPFARELECVLSVEDLARAASELAVLGDDIVEEAESIKRRTKELKEGLKDLQTDEANLRRKVRRKAEPRLVACSRRFDYVRGVIIETRDDTGAQIGSSVMDDTQREMVEVLEPEPVRAEFEGGGVLRLLPTSTQVEDRAEPGVVDAVGLVNLSAVAVELDAETRELALGILRDTKRASTSGLQRRMRIGFVEAEAIMAALEREGFVGPARGSEPREINEAKLAEVVGDAAAEDVAH